MGLFHVDRRPQNKSFGPSAKNQEFWYASSSTVVASPRLPLSQWEAQTLSSLSSKPWPCAITAGGSGFIVVSPRLPLSQREAQTSSSLSSKPPPTMRVGSCPAHGNKSCRPNSPTDHVLTYDFLGSWFHQGQQHARNKILQTPKGTRKYNPGGRVDENRS